MSGTGTPCSNEHSCIVMNVVINNYMYVLLLCIIVLHNSNMYYDYYVNYVTCLYCLNLNNKHIQSATYEVYVANS